MTSGFQPDTLGVLRAMKILRNAAPYLFLALILSAGKSVLAQAPTTPDHHGKHSDGQPSSDPTFITDPVIVIDPVG
jgi:hypothetical protein